MTLSTMPVQPRKLFNVARATSLEQVALGLRPALAVGAYRGLLPTEFV